MFSRSPPPFFVSIRIRRYLRESSGDRHEKGEGRRGENLEEDSLQSVKDTGVVLMWQNPPSMRRSHK